MKGLILWALALSACQAPLPLGERWEGEGGYVVPPGTKEQVLFRLQLSGAERTGEGYRYDARLRFDTSEGEKGFDGVMEEVFRDELGSDFDLWGSYDFGLHCAAGDGPAVHRSGSINADRDVLGGAVNNDLCPSMAAAVLFLVE